MDQSDKPVARGYPTFLAGPWPVVLLLACHFALGLSAASRKSVTFDEITHLSSGYIYWAANDYRMDPESGNWPQRWAALPLWLKGYHFPSLDDPSWRTDSQWNIADRFFHNSDNNADTMLLQGRAMIGLLSVALGLLVYLWSRQLFGPIGGLISLTLYAFSPTMLSHRILSYGRSIDCAVFHRHRLVIVGPCAPHFLVHAGGKLLCTGRIVLVEVLRRIGHPDVGADDRRPNVQSGPDSVVVGTAARN